MSLERSTYIFIIGVDHKFKDIFISFVWKIGPITCILTQKLKHLTLKKSFGDYPIVYHRTVVFSIVWSGGIHLEILVLLFHKIIIRNLFLYHFQPKRRGFFTIWQIGSTLKIVSNDFLPWLGWGFGGLRQTNTFFN